MAFMVLLPVIVFVGVLTSISDLRKKKIYNQHLTIGSVLSILVVSYVSVFGQEDIFFHLVNGGVACIVGFLLYRSALWKGGDAKLFILYAFIMPAPYYDPVPFSCAVNLFACSFLAGLIILSPIFIKDIVINYKGVANHLFSMEKRRPLFLAIMQLLAYSWIFYPLCDLLRINNPIAILAISYFVFHRNYYANKDIEKNYMINFLKKAYIKLLLAFILGILLRLWVSPDSLSLPFLRHYFLMVILSGVLSMGIRTTVDFFKDYQQRIAFAPILLIGCILSYTPFLKEVMQMIFRWKQLLYAVT